MVMKYYGANTPNVQRGILPLFEAEVDVEKELELVRVNMMARQNKEPLYLSKHPFGLVPSLEDGDLIIFESRSIAKYIAEKYNTSLLGKTLEEKATITKWTESEAHHFNPSIAPVVKELFLSKAFNKPANQELITSCLTNLNSVLDVYEAHLSKGNKYLAGDSFTLADAFHTPYSAKVKALFPDLVENRPHVSAWIADITSRPAFQKTTTLDWENASLLESK